MTKYPAPNLFRECLMRIMLWGLSQSTMMNHAKILLTSAKVFNNSTYPLSYTYSPENPTKLLSKGFTPSSVKFAKCIYNQNNCQAFLNYQHAMYFIVSHNYRDYHWIVLVPIYPTKILVCEYYQNKWPQGFPFWREGVYIRHSSPVELPVNASSLSIRIPLLRSI